MPRSAKKTHERRAGSAYPRDISLLGGGAAERELNARAMALYDAVVAAGCLHGGGHFLGLAARSGWNPRAGTPPKSHTAAWYLWRETRRIDRRPWERAAIYDAAFSYVELLHLLNIHEPNPAVVARYAVEIAFDVTRRCLPQQVLGGTSSPRAWVWRWVRGRSSLFQRWLLPTTGFAGAHAGLDPSDPVLLDPVDDPGDAGFVVAHDVPLPGAAVRELRSLPWALDTLKEGVLVELALKVRPTILWVADPLRPPLVTVQLAAEILKQAGTGKGSIVFIEPGHSVAAMALAAWSGRDVHVLGGTYDEQEMFEPGRSQAVVLNLPRRSAIEFTRLHLVGGVHLDRLTEAAWRADRLQIDRIEHVGTLVRRALDALKPGGVVIVLGDVDDGLGHVANDLLHQHEGLRPLPVQAGDEVLDTVDRPILATFRGRADRTPAGSIPPTDRIVSAWRRVT